jgi:3-hydroxymyristoyl/3-hydroxydecanoyl-(acyl carrier protein) dehydratase
MSDHFAAFSFVDRITGYEPAVRALGRFAVPGDVREFPSCLVAEAVGQLAAWVAMAHIGFRGRPVAALANETRFHATAAPGDVLELGVEIESCDDDAVAYAGWARRDGVLLIELADCLGPMLPVEEFDSPAALRERFELLRTAGAEPARFHGVPALALVPDGGTPGESLRATLSVPAAAPFFADHFPRRAVFPATLLLDAQIRLGLALAAQAPGLPHGARPTPARMTHVKMRSFIAPGSTLALGAELAPATRGAAKVMLSAQDNGRTVATARLECIAGAGQ